MQMHINHYVRDTSMLSFIDIQDKLSDRHTEYINSLVDIGKPSSDSEVTSNFGKQDPNYFRPRRYELMKYNIIKEYGKDKCSVTGKRVYKWYFTKRGLEIARDIVTLKFFQKEEIMEFEVLGSTGNKYKVTVHRNPDWVYCTCKGFKYNHYCHHIRDNKEKIDNYLKYT